MTAADVALHLGHQEAAASHRIVTVDSASRHLGQTAYALVTEHTGARRPVRAWQGNQPAASSNN
jgi:hypothetical protein